MSRVLIVEGLGLKTLGEAILSLPDSEEPVQLLDNPWEPLPLLEEPEKVFISGRIAEDFKGSPQPNRRRFKRNARKAKK